MGSGPHDTERMRKGEGKDEGPPGSPFASGGLAQTVTEAGTGLCNPGFKLLFYNFS